MKKTFIFLLCIGLALGPAPGAQASCYDKDDLEAEMLLRLHSELMVVTLACRTSSTGAPLPPVYGGFTQKYLQWIKNSESRLMRWFRKQGIRSPQSKLDRLRTELGNGYSQEIADLSPLAFCDKYRDNTAKAADWSRQEIERRLTILAAAHPPRAPLCKSARSASTRVE